MRLSGSRTGRAWAAVREDDVAAGALGINPPLVKLLAFATGAAFAGVAGAGFAQLFGYVEPSEFDFTVSLMVLAAVVIGGRWGVAGAMLGRARHRRLRPLPGRRHHAGLRGAGRRARTTPRS